MTTMTAKHALDRLKYTSQQSPLAFFLDPKNRMIDVVFASTVMTQQRIAQNDPSLIGVFHRETADAARFLIAKHVKCLRAA